MNRTTGFTLVEMLVVVVIVGVLASTVVLGFVGADREQNLRTEAERLTALIELARSESLQRNEEWGVNVAADGYGFKVYSPDRARWEDVQEPPFQARTIDLITLSVRIEAFQLPDAESKADVPAIVILSSGEQTPFEIELIPTWQTQSWIVASDGFARTEARRGA